MKTAAPAPAFYPPMMRTGKAAAYLGLSRRFVQQLSAAGRLPYHRVGPRAILYSRADLDAFLESCRVAAPVSVEG